MQQQLANKARQPTEQQKTRQDDRTADRTTVLTNIIMKHGPFSRRGPKYQSGLQ